MIETDGCGDPAGGGPAYEYLLAVGPSRSGTTFLYRLLSAHPAFRAPEIKEAHFYRSARRRDRALGRLSSTGAILLDVADTVVGPAPGRRRGAGRARPAHPAPRPARCAEKRLGKMDSKPGPVFLKKRATLP